MSDLLKYENFDLEILPHGGKYLARVLHSPGGEGSAEFRLPFTDDEIEKLLVKMGFKSEPEQVPDKTKRAAAKEFGGKLFDTVFVGQIARLWYTSLPNREEPNGLRLRLLLNQVPELAELPWEFLFDSSKDEFLNQSEQTPLVRFLTLAAPRSALKVQAPLKILVVLSLPGDWQQLQADQEWENLQKALGELIQRGVIALERTDEATLDALQKKLRQQQYHILHFVGHGVYSSERQENVLILENEENEGREIDSRMLGTLLSNHRSLRLVLLNACEGARANRRDPFGGVAQKLIQRGIPAVVAMQFAISDTAALKLSKTFYAALADNYPIDAALVQARLGILFDDNELEWATPVLYSRAPDGVLFDVQAASPVAAPPDKREASFEEVFKLALRAHTEAEQILEETPVEQEAWLAKFSSAYELLQKADGLQRDNPRVAFYLGRVLARLHPDKLDLAREQFRRVERILADTTNEAERNLIVEALVARATLTDPPNEKILERANALAQTLNDTFMQGQIAKAHDRLKPTHSRALEDFYGEAKPQREPEPPSPSSNEFVPSGRWNIQVQDMVGSRMYIEFSNNGGFQMMQQVGMYQVPVKGTWTFNPLTSQLALQGVVNTFQPLTLNMTISGKLPNGFAAVGSDGIGYVLTRG